MSSHRPGLLWGGWSSVVPESHTVWYDSWSMEAGCCYTKALICLSSSAIVSVVVEEQLGRKSPSLSALSSTQLDFINPSQISSCVRVKHTDTHVSLPMTESRIISSAHKGCPVVRKCLMPIKS